MDKVSLLGRLVVHALSPAGQDHRIQAGPGILFPGRIMTPSGKEHVLLAIGTRQMTIFKFGLYAIGLYVEESALPVLKETIDLLDVGKLFMQQLDWSLRIVPIRNGSLAHLRDALCRRLSSADKAEKVDETTLSKFHGSFPNVPFPMGSVLMFHWDRRAGLLDIIKGDKRMGSITSQSLGQHLIGVYLTSKEASAVPSLVEDFQDTMQNL